MTREQEPDSTTSGKEGFLRRWSRRKDEAKVAQISSRSDLPDAVTQVAAAGGDNIASSRTGRRRT